jgi:NADH-quinone oxidoreductase subunit N
MYFTFSDFFSSAYCEMFLLFSILLMLIIGILKLDKSARLLEIIAPFTLVSGIGIILLSPHSSMHSFNGAFINDYFACSAKIFILFLGIVLFLSIPYAKKGEHLKLFEYILLTLFAILAMLIMCSTIEFIVAFISLEILSLSTYVLVAINKQQKITSEAAMKLFIYGSVSTALFLFGISFLYGVTGSTHFDSISTDLQAAIAQKIDISFAIIGLVFILCAFAFKLALAPLHFWLPDIFQGVSTPMLVFVATLPKFAEYILLLRILWQAFPALNMYWQPILGVFGIFSLVLGTFGALHQKKVKRFLAYSSTANMGFVLISLAQATELGVAASTFYFALYLFTLISFILLLMFLESKGYILQHLTDFSGLSKKRPFVAFFLVFCLLSFAGIPFAPGFFSKVYVLYSPVYMESYGLVSLAILCSLISIGYYLRIIGYIVAPPLIEEGQKEKTLRNPILKLTIIASGIILLGLLLSINTWVYVSYQLALSLIH